MRLVKKQNKRTLEEAYIEGNNYSQNKTLTNSYE